MQFIEMSGATLLELADEDQVPQLREAGVSDTVRIRINPQGDVEMLKGSHWSVIGGLLGDYAHRYSVERAGWIPALSTDLYARPSGSWTTCSSGVSGIGLVSIIRRIWRRRAASAPSPKSSS